MTTDLEAIPNSNTSSKTSEENAITPDVERLGEKDRRSLHGGNISMEPIATMANTEQSTSRPKATPTTNQHDSGKKLTKRQRVTEILKWFVMDQWFLIIMGILILISSQIQVPKSQQQIKRTVVSYLSVSVIFFINGCTFPTKLLIENYSRWRIHLFVQLQCYLVTSAATFALVSLCATNPHFMDPWLLIGLLFVGCAPTTMSSNVVMTRQAHGNAALTVVQSIIGQFLCPFLTPVLLQMYLSSGASYTHVLVNDGDNYAEIYRRVFKQLGLSLFIPMFVGQIVRYFFPTAVDTVFVKWKLMRLASFALLTMIWQTFDQAFGSGAFSLIRPSNTIFLVFMSIVLYFVWVSLCFASATVWLPKRDVIACCYCSPAKAIAMVVPVSSVMYLHVSVVEQSKLQIPIILYQGFQVSCFLVTHLRRGRGECGLICNRLLSAGSSLLCFANGSGRTRNKKNAKRHLD
jgi:sodium/bile acid cotransporter 7